MLPEDYFADFQHRIVQQALVQATHFYWVRRAIALEDARHRPGVDYPGRATTGELRARWAALTEEAKACRARATLGLAPEMADEIAVVLEEVAA